MRSSGLVGVGDAAAACCCSGDGGGRTAAE